MRYFPLLDFQMVVLLTFLGLTVLFLLYLAFGSSILSGRPKEGEEVEEHPAEIQALKRPIPPLLIFIYIAFVVWAMVYVIVVGLEGEPF